MSRDLMMDWGNVMSCCGLMMVDRGRVVSRDLVMDWCGVVRGNGLWVDLGLVVHRCLVMDGCLVMDRGLMMDGGVMLDIDWGCGGLMEVMRGFMRRVSDSVLRLNMSFVWALDVGLEMQITVLNITVKRLVVELMVLTS